jgi:hypothetical protein
MIWRSENSWPYQDSNSDPSVVEPVASRYTDCATATLFKWKTLTNIEERQKEDTSLPSMKRDKQHIRIQFTGLHFILRHYADSPDAVLHFNILKKSYPLDRLWKPIGLWKVEDSALSRQPAHRWRIGCQLYAPAALYSPETFSGTHFC